MATSPAVTQQPSLEDKILQAAAEGAKIADIFAPAIGDAVKAGVAVEPIVAALIRGVIGLFHHHTKVKPRQ